jgi:hypothetical protein
MSGWPIIFASCKVTNERLSRFFRSKAAALDGLFLLKTPLLILNRVPWRETPEPARRNRQALTFQNKIEQNPFQKSSACDFVQMPQRQGARGRRIGIRRTRSNAAIAAFGQIPEGCGNFVRIAAFCPFEAVARATFPSARPTLGQNRSQRGLEDF